MIQQTSLLSYADLPYGVTDREKILHLLERSEIPLSSCEIAMLLGMQHSTVSGRKKELFDDGMIYSPGTRKCDCHNQMVMTWRKACSK